MKLDVAKLNAVHPIPLSNWGPKIRLIGLLKKSHNRGRIGIIIAPILSNFTLPNLSDILPSNGKINRATKEEERLIIMNIE